jgi:hypothetical protein
VAPAELMKTAAGPDGKRHLPLVAKTEVATPEDEDRPPWHWSAIGTVGVFVLWTPPAIALQGILAGHAPGLALVGLNTAAFILASFGSGFLVGRFGGKAGRREAMVGGAAAGATAWLLAATQGVAAEILGWALLLAVMVGLGGAAARAGGALGVARRGAG